MSSDQEVKLYTVGEVANLTGLSERTIHRWIKSGKLPIVRFDRQVRVRHTDLAALIEKHQQIASQQQSGESDAISQS